MSSNECDCAVPLPAEKREDLDKITIYGTWFNQPGKGSNPTGVIPLQHHVLAYGFAFQGHCYRLSIPAEYRFEYYSREEVWVPQMTRDEAGKCAPAQAELRGDTKCVSIFTKVPKAPVDAMGCGFDGNLNYLMWTIDRTVPVQRIERRQGLAEELILDFNLPGRPPSTLTYSAKTAIASRAGKVHE